MRLHHAALVVPLLLTMACVKEYFPPTAPDDTGSSTPTSPPAPVVHTVEFRALGTAREATLQYGDASNGATELQTLIPWEASFSSTKSTLFVYITGIATNEGILRVQIFIDGQLFREAATDGTLGAQASASGTAQLSPTTAGFRR